MQAWHIFFLMIVSPRAPNAPKAPKEENQNPPKPIKPKRPISRINPPLDEGSTLSTKPIRPIRPKRPNRPMYSMYYFGLDSLTTNFLPSTSASLRAAIASSAPEDISTKPKPLERFVPLSIITFAESTVPCSAKDFQVLDRECSKEGCRRIYSYFP